MEDVAEYHYLERTMVLRVGLNYTCDDAFHRTSIMRLHALNHSGALTLDAVDRLVGVASTRAAKWAIKQGMEKKGARFVRRAEYAATTAGAVSAAGICA